MLVSATAFVLFSIGICCTSIQQLKGRLSMSKKQVGFLLIIAAAVFATFAFVIWPFAAKQPAERSSPAQAVEGYYDWYLDYIGEPGSDDFRNPLVDRAYRDSEYLSASFVGHVDELLSAVTPMGADPFLCAQDIPTFLKVDAVLTTGETASVVMRSSFDGHVFTVDTQETDEGWLITNVTCGGSPEGVAKAFYTWYLAYFGDRAAGEMNNPLVDGAYRESGFLTDAFIQRVDEELDAQTPGGGDPFLLAQDIPHAFSVDPGREADTAIVHLQFGSETVHHLQLAFERQDGHLLIDQIELAQ
jgi:hypothetical protein